MKFQEEMGKLSNGKKENRKDAVLMRKMWTTELDRTERWRNMNT